jgi:signal transduction histidine kinase
MHFLILLKKEFRVDSIIKAVRKSQVITNVFYMLGFGILSFILAKIRFYIPGVEGGRTDLREVSALIAVLYMPHWIYLIGISIIGSLNFFNTEVHGAYFITTIAHSFASILIWYAYHFLIKKKIRLYKLGGMWALMILIYYYVLLTPLIIIFYYLFGNIAFFEIIPGLLANLRALYMEIFTVMIVTTSYVVLLEMARRLDMALKKSQESDRLKSAFLANMSHEIRTPMNGIIGFSNLLAESDVNDEKRQEYGKIINASGKQLLSIINDILDISRIEARQIEIKSSLFPANKLMDEIYLFNLASAKEKSLSLVIQKSLSDIESNIYTDQNKLRQILDNLLNNAIKFTAAGFITIGYEVSNKNISFYVEDSGPGIHETDRDRIFDRFTQADLGNDQLYGGTGLGLSISKGLTDALGGEIRLDSSPGKGSRFSLIFSKEKLQPEKMNIRKTS